MNIYTFRSLAVSAPKTNNSQLIAVPTLQISRLIMNVRKFVVRPRAETLTAREAGY